MRSCPRDCVTTERLAALSEFGGGLSFRLMSIREGLGEQAVALSQQLPLLKSMLVESG